MGIDYILLAILLIYILVVRLSSIYNLGILLPSLAVTIGPALLMTTVKAIAILGYDAPLSQLLSVQLVVLTVSQFIVAYVIFTKLNRDDQSLPEWLCWAIGGAAVLYFVLPFVTTKLI